MTIAEIRGKISRTGQNLSERMEDLLTSDVFSACRYVRPNILLIPFLRQAKHLNGQILGSLINEEVKSTRYSFWPRLRLSEPDVLIALELLSGFSFLIMIEAKYLSLKASAASGEEELEVAEVPSDQLAREYADLLKAHEVFHIRESKVAGRALVYVTAHRSFPKDCVEESFAEIIKFYPDKETVNLFWTNWFELHPLVAQLKDTTGIESDVLNDLRLLLERKRLLHFSGFKLDTAKAISEGIMYCRKTEERLPLYKFSIAQETVWAIPVFYSSRAAVREYHFDVVTAELPCKIYEGGDNE